MKKLPFIILVLLFAACKDNNTNLDKDLPSCIQEKVNEVNLTEPVVEVRTQDINGEIHYWLHTEAMHLDGEEFIVNENCEDLCHFCGECLPPDCTYDYDHDNWETIWVN